MQQGRTAQQPRRAVWAAAIVGALIAGATVGRTSAAFTATAPVTGGATSGVVALDTGGVEQLTFNGTSLSAIGPGASFAQSVTVLNESTVTTPSTYTDIALWADITGTSTLPADLGASLLVTITRSIGGGTALELYSGTVVGLAQFGTFTSSLGDRWGSRNAGGATGTEAVSAIYTFSFSLPASATAGADSSIAVAFTFEARNRTE